MARRHCKSEQIIHMLREAEIKLAGGNTTGEVCRVLGQPRSTPRYSVIKAGTLTTSVWNASGVARA